MLEALGDGLGKKTYDLSKFSIKQYVCKKSSFLVIIFFIYHYFLLGKLNIKKSTILVISIPHNPPSQH